MADETTEMSSEKRDSIELKMDAKGKQYWIIKMYFDRGTEGTEKVIDDIVTADSQMRVRFG